MFSQKRKNICFDEIMLGTRLCYDDWQRDMIAKASTQHAGVEKPVGQKSNSEECLNQGILASLTQALKMQIRFPPIDAQEENTSGSTAHA